MPASVENAWEEGSGSPWTTAGTDILIVTVTTNVTVTITITITIIVIITTTTTTTITITITDADISLCHSEVLTIQAYFDVCDDATVCTPTALFVLACPPSFLAAHISSPASFPSSLNPFASSPVSRIARSEHYSQLQLIALHR
jgi:hypothetical protein